VTIVIRRRIGVFAGLAAAAALLTACSSGPSQVGNALIVGNNSVSVSQVQQELNALLASQPAVKQAQKQGQLALYSRNIVTTNARHDLVGKVAAANQVTVTDEEVDQLISGSGGAAKLAPALATTPANLHGVVKDLLLEVGLARKNADGLTVQAAVLDEKNRATAVTTAQKLANDPTSLPALVKAANAAAGGQQAAIADQTFSVSQYLQSVQSQQQQAQSQGQQAPPENEGPLFGTPANTVVIFQISTQAPDWFVALIKARHPNGNATRPTTGSVADASDLMTLQQLGVSLMQPDASRAGVRVSPRYGVWDPVGVQVLGSQNQAGQLFPVAQKP
jgi:hypothetical protein